MMDIAIHPAAYNGKDMRAWLEERPYYTLDDASVLYSSEATGVEFCFNFYDPGFYPPDVPHQPHVTFYLEYFRPHVFALEAEPELAGFLRRFNCRVEDVENTEAIGIAPLDGPYSREAFLARWNAGNRAAFRQEAGSRAPPPWPADPALLDAIWKWNYGRAALQQTVGNQVFVPRIIWARPDGADDPVPASMWTNRAPTMIPESLVTHIALVRKPRHGLAGMLGLSRPN
ncbi:MAG TPA: hypothetical protein VFV70_12430, partial [Hyphomonadaceae bacterium]|nr:hypothetical protein [Hyphomonadaceae bacterium]